MAFPRAHLTGSVIATAFAGSFVLTVFLFRFFSLSDFLWAMITIGCGAIVCILLKRIVFGVILLSMLFGTIGATLSVLRTTHIEEGRSIERFALEETVTITGVIVEEPDVRPMQTKYTIDVQTIAIDDLEASVHGRVLVSDHNGYPEFHYGDLVSATGKLERPGMIEEFDYAAYLSLSDVYALMYRSNIRQLEEGHGNPFLAWTFRQKARLELQIARLYHEPYASFLMGLLTGSRRGLPESVTEYLQVTGLTHVVAISGYNITIIIVVLSQLLFFLPIKWRFLPTAFGIAFFTLFVGASASVVRAAIMGIMGLLAIQTERKTDMRLLILWAAVFMLAWNPKYLWYDAGFQLSFLALLGLTELSPYIEKRLSFLPAFLGIRTALSATLSAQVSTLPLTIFLFDRISLIAPLTNLIVAPLIPFAMLFGFLGTILSFLHVELGLSVGFIGFGFLEIILKTAEYGAKIPYAAVDSFIP